MTNDTYFWLLICAVAGFALGWVACRAYVKTVPTERELALKLATRATQQLIKLKSSAPQQAVALAAQAAAEAEALKQFQEAAASLT